jgi:hypothetical protein
MTAIIGTCRACQAPAGPNTRVHVRGAHIYCVDCAPANDAPRAIWDALTRFTGWLLPCAALVAILAVPCLGGNARSDRTALSFQRDQVRRQYLNAQWARHYAAAREAPRYHQNGQPLNYAAQMQDLQGRSNSSFAKWRENGPRPQVLPGYGESMGPPRRLR